MKVAIACKVGDDDAGAQVAQQLRAVGIDLRWLRREPGQRTTIWHEPREPESRRLERGADQSLRLDELPSPTLASARLTIVSGFSLSVEPARSAAVWALETAERRGGRSALLLEADRLWSTNARMTRRVLEPALAAAYTVALNSDDTRALYGPRVTANEAARSIAQAGPRVVYVEGGEAGAVLYESGRVQALSARADGAPADRFAGPAAFWKGLASGTTARKAALTAMEYAASVRRAGAPRRLVHV
jgi:sugar/nucleoside kinase (ribokinase family)